MQTFDNIADYYEVLTNAAARLAREGPLLRENFDAAPGDRVFDLACGTGLHALFFAELGADVTAADASKDMVRHAENARPHPGIRYRVMDMRSVSGGPWDLAVCLGNSLALLPLREDLDRTFAAVAAALSPGGRFLVQLLNFAAENAQAPRHRVERKPLESGRLVAVKSLVPHENHTLLTLAFFAGAAGAYRTATDTAVLSHWTEDDLLQAAQAAGLTTLASYGSFDGEPFDRDKSGDYLGVFSK